MALKYSNYSKMVKILTLDCNFEGILRATELEQSLKETLDYTAHLTWIQVLKSNWFRKSKLSDLALCLKNHVHDIKQR